MKNIQNEIKGLYKETKDVNFLVYSHVVDSALRRKYLTSNALIHLLPKNVQSDAKAVTQEIKQTQTDVTWRIFGKKMKMKVDMDDNN